MKKNFTILLLLIIATLGATAQTIQWQKLLGGVNDDNFNYNVQQTSDGGFISAGQAQSSNTGTLTGITGNGGYDGWIVKTDASGNREWQKLLGGSGDELIYSIQQTTDGGYIVAGYTNSSNTGTLAAITSNGANDGWIIRLDASGNTVWQRLVGGNNNDYLFWIRQTSDGGYIMAGQSYSSNSGTLTGVTNNGSMDGWIIKLDAAGTTTEFQKLLGGSADDFLREIEQTSDGGYIATCGANSGDGTLTGIPGSTAAGSAWVIKLDAAGATTWQKLFGGIGIDNFITIKQTTDGGYIATGYSNTSNDGTLTGIFNNGGMDGWVMKMDASGNTTWQKLLGGTNDDLLPGIQQTAGGSYIVAGYTLSSNSGTLTGLTNNGANDGWIIKLTSAGAVQSQQLFGGNGQDYFQGIYQSLDGGFIVSGYSYSSNSGTFTGLTNNGSSDAWLVKINQITLPVSLLNLKAKHIAANQTELSWQTSSEQNNKGFEVYRSTNGTDFLLIGFVAGAGNSGSLLNYSFNDGAVLQGKVFYRLKQIDQDGNGKFSTIFYVDIFKQTLVTFSPNPVTNFIRIQTSLNSIREIKLVNANGQLIKKWNNVSQNEMLDLGNIAKGIYFIKFIKDDFVETQKLSKE